MGKFDQEVIAKWVSEDSSEYSSVISKEWTSKFPARGWAICWYGLWDGEKFRGVNPEETDCRIRPRDRAIQLTLPNGEKIAFHEAHVPEHQLGTLRGDGKRNIIPRIIEEEPQKKEVPPVKFKPAEPKEEEEARPEMAEETDPAKAESPYSYEYTEITPEKAEEFLERNTHNRSVRESVVNRYATDMANGDWNDDGTPVKFSKSGVLLDGQHRLLAIVESGKTIWMMVVSGLPEETQETMDTGVQRSLADTLKLRGEFNTIQLAAAIKRVTKWEDGHRKTVCSGTNAPSRSRLLRCFQEHPEIKESVLAGARVTGHTGLSTATMALCHWLFKQIDPESCEEFFNALCKPVELEEHDSRYQLSRIASSQGSSRHKKYTPTQILAITIKAWNLYRRGEPVLVLRWNGGGAQRENFPEPE